EIVERLPEGLQVGRGAVDAGAEARMVRVGQRAGELVPAEVLAQPGLLLRVEPAAADGPTVAVAGHEVPPAEVVAVVAAAAGADGADRVEVVVVAARGDVMVLVVAGHGPAPRPEATPRQVVDGAVLVERAGLVLVVAQRQDEVGGERLHYARRLLLPAGVARPG